MSARVAVLFLFVGDDAGQIDFCPKIEARRWRKLHAAGATAALAVCQILHARFSHMAFGAMAHKQIAAERCLPPARSRMPQVMNTKALG